ncbi:MAG: protein kinase domain-containing protein [Parachlamydiaceae bacterium]
MQEVAEMGSKRKYEDTKEAVKGRLYYRDAPIRDGKKRFWTDLFYEKTGKELARGLKKVCYVIKQDHIEFVLLKSKVNLDAPNGAIILNSFYEEREIQLILSKYEGRFVTIIDSFLLKSRKNPNVIKWYTIAEKYEGDFTHLDPAKCPHKDDYIVQIALRMQEIISERIVIPDFKLDNILYLGDKATITDFGSAHFVEIKAPYFCMTMGYQSPERNRYEDGGFPAMIFAFGVCIAQLVYNGKIGFPGDSLDDSVKWIDDNNRAAYRKDMIKWRRNLPKNKYRELILSMTSIVAEKRPTIHKVVESIKQILKQS